MSKTDCKKETAPDFYIKCHYNSDGSIEGSLVIDFQKQKRKKIYQKVNQKLGNR